MTNKIRTLKPTFSWLQSSLIYACSYKFLESGVFLRTYSELTQQPCCAEQGGVSSTYGLDTNHWATLNRKRVLCPMFLTTVCLPHQRKVHVSNGKPKYRHEPFLCRVAVLWLRRKRVKYHRSFPSMFSPKPLPYFRDRRVFPNVQKHILYELIQADSKTSGHQSTYHSAIKMRTL